jgi:tight adherence protein B
MPTEIITLIVLGIGVILAGGLTILGVANVLLAGDNLNERIETYAAVPEETRQRRRLGPGRAQVNRFRMRLNSALSMLSSEQLSLKLLSANWPITETEYILIRIWATIIGLGLGWLIFRSIYPGIGIAIIGFLVPAVLLTRSIHNRQSNFEKQLVDVLVLVKGAVRAGYSFLQALDVVVEEMERPASEEFRRVRREVSLGLPLSQALNNLHERMENDDLYLVVTAVIINQQVGGNLATMLESVTTTIRERVRLFAEVRALTSQQRFSGYLLTVLPFVVAGVLFILSPEYVSKLFEPGIFLCVPIGAVIMILIGNILIRMLAKIDV